ncbi:fibronectin type III-like domain-contianing protein [bacterium]|nr:fibronectin type III-like domain-contianing protein [bacterium]
MTAEPLYPFGFGLSYSKINYEKLNLSVASVKNNQSATATVTVKNIGTMDAEEVVQFYLTDQEASATVPIMSLKGFKRVMVKAGTSADVQFTITPDMLKFVNDKGVEALEKGKFTIYASGSAPITGSIQLGASQWLSTELAVK